jgi:hypothetical protein
VADQIDQQDGRGSKVVGPRHEQGAAEQRGVKRGRDDQGNRVAGAAQRQVLRPFWSVRARLIVLIQAPK